MTSWSSNLQSPVDVTAVGAGHSLNLKRELEMNDRALCNVTVKAINTQSFHYKSEAQTTVPRCLNAETKFFITGVIKIVNCSLKNKLKFKLL